MPLAAALTVLGCGSTPSTPVPSVTGPARNEALGFQDLTTFAGFGALPDLESSGIAAIDVDGDGWDDIVRPAFGESPIFRNTRDGRFVLLGGLSHPGRTARAVYGADLTHDGVGDAIVVTARTMLLFKGRGDGGFDLWQALPPISEAGVAVVATFGDFDFRGSLSLFYGRLLEVPGVGEDDKACHSETAGQEATALAGNFLVPDGATDIVYTDHTSVADLSAPHRVQAAATFDVNGDGALDLLVGTEGGARDPVYLSDGHGKFIEYGVELGFTAETSAMGFDFADIDGDGDAEIFVSDFLPVDGGQLWVRGADGRYVNEAGPRGLEGLAQYSPWGVAFVDVENDGDVDLFLVNSIPPEEGGCENIPQERLLFLNDGQGHFTRFEGAAGSGLDAVTGARGAAFSDFDHDGDVDAVVASTGGRPQLLRNELGTGHWLGLRLRYPWFDPAVGAIVTVRAGGRTFMRWVAGTTSFGGSSSHVIHVGLGAIGTVESIDVTWPNRLTQTLANVGSADRVIDVPYAPARN